MKNGEFPDGSHTLRAKIDMASPNMNLRDPAIYRIVHAHHHRQGDKWCIYPLYDYAHPIQDALEGITHSPVSYTHLDVYKRQGHESVGGAVLHLPHLHSGRCCSDGSGSIPWQAPYPYFKTRTTYFMILLLH